MTSCANALVPHDFKGLRDSEVTAAMGRWAHEIETATRSNSGNYGAIYYKVFDGVPIAAIVQRHPWTTNAKGERIDCNPCCHGVTLFHPPVNFKMPGMEPEPVPAKASVASNDTAGIVLFSVVLFGTAFAAARAFFEAKRV